MSSREYELLSLSGFETARQVALLAMLHRECFRITTAQGPTFDCLPRSFLDFSSECKVTGYIPAIVVAETTARFIARFTTDRLQPDRLTVIIPEDFGDLGRVD